MLDTPRVAGGPSVETAAPRAWKTTLDGVIRALVLIRFGQELGTDSKLSQTIAATIDVVVAAFAKFVG